MLVKFTSGVGSFEEGLDTGGPEASIPHASDKSF